MSNESPEAAPASNSATAPAAEAPAAAAASAEAPASSTVTAEAAPPKPERVRKAVTALKSHPVGVIALAGAAVALVEVEIAVGILAGIGATALLVTKTGPEARQEVLSKGNEVLTKGKLALAKAKGKLRSKPAAEKVPDSPEPPAAAA